MRFFIDDDENCWLNFENLNVICIIIITRYGVSYNSL